MKYILILDEKENIESINIFSGSSVSTYQVFAKPSLKEMYSSLIDILWVLIRLFMCKQLLEFHL